MHKCSEKKLEKLWELPKSFFILFKLNLHLILNLIIPQYKQCRRILSNYFVCP